MNLDNQILTGGAAIGIAWAVREFLGFIIKLRKQDQEQFYKPEEHWKDYITEKFDDLSRKLNQLYNTQELLKSQISRLEFEITKMIKTN